MGYLTTLTIEYIFPQVTPLTALKFAELSAEAGFPKGVINILPGSGKTLTSSLLFRIKLDMICAHEKL